MLKYGSLFSGYGGLDMGVQSVLGGETAWFCEFDKAPSKILAHHWPDVPNLGDITKVDWTQVEPVDVLTGGYPCQPFSHAGKRAGVEDDRHLWPYVAQAIAAMRPGLCVFENVRGHLSLGFDEVLRDLQQLGYSVTWYLLRAADVGAAHGRARLFIFAEDTHDNHAAVCSRTHRRGGDYRDQPHHGGHVHAEGGDRDGNEILGDPHRDEEPVGRAPRLHEAGDRTPRTEGSVDARERTGRRVPGGDRPAPDPEAGAGDGRGRAESTRDGQQGGARSLPLDGRGSREVRGAEAPDARPERSGTGTEGAEAASRDSRGCLQVGLVVGARGEPVRPGGVRGPAAGVRPDGCWACVRDALMERAAGFGVDPAAVPADSNLTGLEGLADQTRAAQAGRRGHVESGTVGPDLTLLPTPTSSDTNGPGAHGDGGADLRTTVSLLPTPRATDGTKGGPNQRGSSGDLMLPSAVNLLPTPTAVTRDRSPEEIERRWLDGERGSRGRNLDDMTAHASWGDYAAAIARWEHVIGRAAPDPTEPGAKGNPRLSPKFVEWLMGLPEGHVTDVGITRNEQLKALGNGVVPQQAAAATRAWVEDTAMGAAA